MAKSEKCPTCGETKITFTKKEKREQVKITRKIVIGFKNDKAYRQLIADWLEENNPSSRIKGFTFGRIMNFLWENLPEEEKYLYVVIRNKINLQYLSFLLSRDWVDGEPIRMKRLIQIARKWENERQKRNKML